MSCSLSITNVLISSIFLWFISKPLICENLGVQAAREIANNRPYATLQEFVNKTDPSIVDSKAIGALIDGGYFRKLLVQDKEQTIKKFSQYREDFKLAGKKGLLVQDLFSW